MLTEHHHKNWFYHKKRNWKFALNPKNSMENGFGPLNFERLKNVLSMTIILKNLFWHLNSFVKPRVEHARTHVNSFEHRSVRLASEQKNSRYMDNFMLNNRAATGMHRDVFLFFSKPSLVANQHFWFRSQNRR